MYMYMWSRHIQWYNSKYAKRRFVSETFSENRRILTNKFKKKLFFFINGWKVEILINSTKLLKYYIQNMWKNKNDHLSTVNDNDNKVKVHLGLLTLRFKGHKKSIFIIMSNFIILRNNWYMEFEILSFSDYEFNFDI